MQSNVMSSRTSTSSRTELPDQEKDWETTPTPPNDEENPQPQEEEGRDKQGDPNIVDWDGTNDPENPRNWSTGYKSWITCQLGMLALSASLGSSIIAPAEKEIAKYVGVSTEVAVLAISLYMYVAAPSFVHDFLLSNFMAVWVLPSDLYAGHLYPRYGGVDGRCYLQYLHLVSSQLVQLLGEMHIRYS
jgi:hypothetical protein